MKQKIIAVDFFCGAGGMTCGLIQAGIEVIAGVDREARCETTFRQNINPDGSRPAFLCLDVFEKSDAYPQGQRHAILEQLNDLIAKHTRKGVRPKLIFAICAPCQPFTKITQIEMSERGKFKRSNDANLLSSMIPLIEMMRPDALICENVEGIFGNDEKSVLNIFKGQLEALQPAYSFAARVIDASRFGVPQRRKRTIGLAFDTAKYGSDVVVPSEDPKSDVKLRVSDFIGHLPSIAAGEAHDSIPNHRARALNELNLKRISCALPGESNSYLASTRYGDLSLKCHQDLKARSGQASFSDTYTRMRPDDVAPTITTKCVSITNGRFGHYDTTQHRGLTPREAALLQTFPVDYVFYPEDNLQFAATLIGNAVPPRLGKFFGNYVSDCVSRKLKN
jgi:DNA (cytosine-5)-methyltransferase 1